MGFDLYGEAPADKKGEYFRNNCWYWRPMQMLILLKAGDILTAREKKDLGWNNGGLIPKDKALQIADRLEVMLGEKKDLASTKKKIMDGLGEPYKDCWDEQNIKEFIVFCRKSGGFTIS